jgi:hypothetical protein
MIEDPWVGVGVLFIGSVVYYPIGMIVGILIVKKLFHYPGSLVFGIVGVILGGVTSLLIWGYIIIGGSPLPDPIEWILAFLVTPLLGTLGYCLVRQSTKTIKYQR